MKTGQSENVKEIAGKYVQLYKRYFVIILITKKIYSNHIFYQFIILIRF